MLDIEQLIGAGSYPALLAATRSLEDKEKRKVYKWLLAYWKEHRQDLNDYRAKNGAVRWSCLVIAAAITARDAREALAIPLPNIYPDARQFLLEALAGRGHEWVAAYLALSTSPKRIQDIDVPLSLALFSGFDRFLPDLPEFFVHWARYLTGFNPRYYGATSTPYEEVIHRLKLLVGADGDIQVESQTTVAHSYLEAVSALSGLNILLARLLARKDGILALAWGYASADDLQEITELFTVLVDNGSLDRRRYIDNLIAALTRGDSVTAQRYQTRLLLAAMPEPTLLVHHANSLLSLLASGHGNSAEAAQTLLRRLDESGNFDGEAFANACAMVFARKEKGLRDTQLAWGGRRLTEYPEQAAMTLEGLFFALGVEDFPLQKKLAQTLSKHLALIDSGTRNLLLEQLPIYQTVLEPGLFRQMRTALGDSVASLVTPSPVLAEPADSILPAPPLTRFQVPSADAATLRELQARQSNSPTVETSEQIIAVALELAVRNPQALKLGLQSINGDFPVELLSLFQNAAFGKISRDDLRHRRNELMGIHGRNEEISADDWKCYSWPASGTSVLSDVARLRYLEIAEALLERAPYPFISRPSYVNGAIAVEELLTRLGGLAGDGREAGPMDLLVALMRSDQPDIEDIAALHRIGSRQAVVAADFFAAGGMAQMTTVWQKVGGEGESGHRKSRSARWLAKEQPEVCVVLQGMSILPAIENIPIRWSIGYTPETAPDIWEFDLVEPFLTGVMPNQGEVLAALNLWGFRKACHDLHSDGGKATARALPSFLAARGTAGPALHLAVLFCLSGRDAESRIAGSDGLLELIAQGRYNSDLASDLVAACIACGSLKVGRLAKSLSQVVEAGACQILWPLVRAALISSLNKAPVPSGTPDLLALACSMVSRLGLREEISVLAETANKNGVGKLLAEARRLNDLLRR